MNDERVGAAVPAAMGGVDEERAAPVKIDAIQSGGRYVTVSILGFGALRRGIPEEAFRLFPERVRKRLSRPQFYLLPRENLKRLRALVQRLRALPSKYGLIVIGFDPRSSGRWIPVSVWDSFLAEYRERKLALEQYLGGLDGERQALYDRWQEIVDTLCAEVGVDGGARAGLLAAFPATFVGLLSVRLIALRISNPVEIEEAAIRLAAARAERLRAEGEAAAAAAEQQERLRLARAAAADVQWVLDQAASIIYDGLARVVEGLAKGGKATGPAIRRLNALAARFQPLLRQRGFSEAGGDDLATWLKDLQVQAGRFARGRYANPQAREQARRQVLNAAQRVMDVVQRDAQNWVEMVDETVRAVAW